MTLFEVIANNIVFGDEYTIYAAKHEGIWSRSSDARVVWWDTYAEGDPEAPSGTIYFLEMSLVREVIEAYADHAKKLPRDVSDEEKFVAVHFYAVHDAYLPVGVDQR